MTDPASIKADLVPYSAEYSSQVRSWIDTEETYRLVCRGSQFPPPEDAVDGWQREGVTSYLMFSERRPVAYGELWDRSGEQAIELNHIIVDQYKRSRGLGTKMVQLLYERASTHPGIAKVLLNLYNDSQEVLGCYLKAGFELVGTATHIEGLKMVRWVRK